MSGAWIGDQHTSVDIAMREAAGWLAASRLSVFAGMSTDVAGARAAVALAERIGGVVDHMQSAALLQDLDVMREGGLMLTTPAETYNRCDLLLLVGPQLLETALIRRLFDGPDRRSIWLCPGRKIEQPGVDLIGSDPADLPGLVATLRARVAGRPIAPNQIPKVQIEQVAASLAQASFGVAIWSAAAIEALTLVMLCGLVTDLNEKTRFSGLPIAPEDNGIGVQQVLGWRSGFPVRTGFGRGYAEHDPWRFDSVRLVESGEADCAVWISALSSVRPPFRRAVPLITLAPEPEELRVAGEILIEVGRPGIDHDSIAQLDTLGALAAMEATTPNDTLSVSDVLAGIAANLPAARTC